MNTFEFVLILYCIYHLISFGYFSTKNYDQVFSYRFGDDYNYFQKVLVMVLMFVVVPILLPFISLYTYIKWFGSRNVTPPIQAAPTDERLIPIPNPTAYGNIGIRTGVAEQFIHPVTLPVDGTVTFRQELAPTAPSTGDNEYSKFGEWYKSTLKK